MLPQLALFRDHAITQPYVQPPKFIQRLSHICRRRLKLDITYTVGEVCKETSDVYSDHSDCQLPLPIAN